MNVTAKNEQDVTVITVSEASIDIGNSEDFREALTKFSDSAQKHIVMDMTLVKNIDSSGIGVLVMFWQFTREAGKDLRLANCSSRVIEILRTTKLDDKIKNFASLAEAMKH